MDMQKFMDALTESARMSRMNYHLTLGQLLDLCETYPALTVVSDRGFGIANEHSYRGYYADLAFETGTEPTGKEVAAMLERAMTETYTGYKGGDFTYDRDTPLWLASYGCCGDAIIDAKVEHGQIVLTTKRMDR